jgi:hypothetical protein
VQERQLIYAADSREVHFAIPLLTEGQYHTSLRLFGFIGYRDVVFQDGRCLVGWCSGTCSSPKAAALRDMVSGCDYRYATAVSICGEEVSVSRRYMCPCADLLLDHIGMAELRASMTLPALCMEETASDGVALDEFQIMGRQYRCVNTGTGEPGDVFSRWGVVRQRTMEGDAAVTYLCYTHYCSWMRRYCVHSSVLAGKGPLPAAYMDPADFEEHFRGLFDVEQGRLRRKCISWERLPEEPEDDVVVRQHMEGNADLRSQSQVPVHNCMADPYQT